VFITLPTFPPRADGHPDTSRTVPMTIATALIALMSYVEVPSQIVGATKQATLIGLTMPGQSLITPLAVDEILTLIREAQTETSLAQFRKLN
jgi:hypothetical protein